MELNITDMSQEDAEMILGILDPIVNAIERVDYYNADSDIVCTDDAVIAANDPDNGGFELFADVGEQGGLDPHELLRLGHLRQVKELYDTIKSHML